MSDDMVTSGILPSMMANSSEIKYIGGACPGADEDSDSDVLDCELSGCEQPDDSDAEGGDFVVERPPIEYNELVAEALAYLNNIHDI